MAQGLLGSLLGGLTGNSRQPTINQVSASDDHMMVQVPGTPGLLSALGLDNLLAGLGLGTQYSYAYVPRDSVIQRSLPDQLDEGNDVTDVETVNTGFVDANGNEIKMSPRLLNVLKGIL